MVLLSMVEKLQSDSRTVMINEESNDTLWLLSWLLFVFGYDIMIELILIWISLRFGFIIMLFDMC